MEIPREREREGEKDYHSRGNSSRKRVERGAERRGEERREMEIPRGGISGNSSREGGEIIIHVENPQERGRGDKWKFLEGENKWKFLQRERERERGGWGLLSARGNSSREREREERREEERRREKFLEGGG